MQVITSPEAASPAERAWRELQHNPDRPDKLIAVAAGVSPATVARARKRATSGQPPAPRRRPQRSRAQQSLDRLLATVLPRMPSGLAERGLCGRHPEPDLWSSDRQADRLAAQRICRSCPVIALCGQWAAQLPPACRTGVVYAGQLPRTRKRPDQGSLAAAG